MFDTYILIFNLGVAEITLIIFVLVLLFGASRLPKLAKSIGDSIKEFQKAKIEVNDEVLEKEIKQDNLNEKSERTI